MENTLGSLLPKFSTSDREKLKMGLDFIGLNHYDSFYVKDCIYSPCEPGLGVTWTEGSYLETSERNGVPIGETVCIIIILIILIVNNSNKLNFFVFLKTN